MEFELVGDNLARARESGGRGRGTAAADDQALDVRRVADMRQ